MSAIGIESDGAGVCCRRRCRQRHGTDRGRRWRDGVSREAENAAGQRSNAQQVAPAARSSARCARPPRHPRPPFTTKTLLSLTEAVPHASRSKRNVFHDAYRHHKRCRNVAERQRRFVYVCRRRFLLLQQAHCRLGPPPVEGRMGGRQVQEGCDRKEERGRGAQW